MRKVIYFFLLFFICFTPRVVAAAKVAPVEPVFHICTIASDKTQGLKQLLISCKVHGITLDILGMGLPYRGNGQKLNYMKEYIKAMPDNDIVLYVDAYDILFLTDKKTILKKFLKMKSSFVISAERNCFPFRGLANKYPESPTPFRYINSGSFMGYVKSMKKILGEIAVNEKISDQGQLTLHYFDHQNEYTLDYRCELFMPLVGVHINELLIDRKRGEIYSLSTRSRPCIVHGNGRGRPLYQVLNDQIFGKT